MKNVTICFGVNKQEAFIDYCEKANLNILDKIVDSTSQDANVYFLVNGKYTDSIDFASDRCTIWNGQLITLFGAFDNNKHGRKRLDDARSDFRKNSSLQLLEINTIPPNP